MSHWIQIRKTGIFFCSTVTSVREVDLNCEFDTEKCSAKVLEEWAREQAEKHGGCDVYDENGTAIISEDDPDPAYSDDGYKWSGYLGQD